MTGVTEKPWYLDGDGNIDSWRPIEYGSGEIQIIDSYGRPIADINTERFGSLYVESISQAPQTARALDECREALEASGWQPIETAPKDGTVVDLWAHWPEHDRWMRTADAVWDAGAQNWKSGFYHFGQYSYPPTVTHWMPLPAPPARAALAKGGRSDAV
jgi:hypothetical protein